MDKIVRYIRSFWKNEKGLETVEYAVMTALIVGALVTAIGALAAAITGRFEAVTEIVEGIE